MIKLFWDLICQHRMLYLLFHIFGMKHIEISEEVRLDILFPGHTTFYSLCHVTLFTNQIQIVIYNFVHNVLLLIKKFSNQTTIFLSVGNLKWHQCYWVYCIDSVYHYKTRKMCLLTYRCKYGLNKNAAS